MLAGLLNVKDPEDLALVENTTQAVNAVFRSFKFSPGDKVLITNTAYQMVKNLLKYLEQKVPSTFPFLYGSSSSFSSFS